MFELFDKGGALESWLAQTDSDVRLRAMAAWLDALVRGPEMVARWSWTREPSGRRVIYSEVPGADVLVGYTFGGGPVRAVFLLYLLDYR